MEIEKKLREQLAEAEENMRLTKLQLLKAKQGKFKIRHGTDTPLIFNDYQKSCLKGQLRDIQFQIDEIEQRLKEIEEAKK